jgi:hypothetical protein
MGYEQELIAEGKCAELVWVRTEDGVVDGRCLQPISDKVWMYRGYSDPEPSPTTLPMCEGHAEERVGYGAMTEAEQATWERRQVEDSTFEPVARCEIPDPGYFPY